MDLAEVLAGAVATSPRLLLSLIHRLPEGSHYVAAVMSSAVHDSDTLDAPAEIDPAQEFRTWTEDRRLMAQLINSVNMLVRFVPQWDKGKAPDMPLVGPAAWRGEGTEHSKPSKPLSVMDVITKITGNNGR